MERHSETAGIYFQAKIVINPLFHENALISLDQGSIKDIINEEGKWQVMGSFHLKFDKWDKHKHSRLLVTKGFGWLKIKNRPLHYRCRKTFEVIGEHSGGLENIATKTLNLTNCDEQ